MRKALVVGINQYPDNRLYGCVNDAKAIAQKLSTNDDGSANFDVRVEENVANKNKLMSLVHNLFDCDYEMCLFYYAGHGALNSYGNGYIVTPDKKEFDQGVSMDEIIHIANLSKAKNRLIILDCCYAGALGSPAFAGGKICHIGEGVTIMTATRRNGKSAEYNGHGLFTGLLLEALNGAAADISGMITPAGMYAYVDRCLGAWQQRPVFKTNTSNFVSLRTVTPEVPLAILKEITTYFADEESQHKLDPSYEYTNDPDMEHKVILPYAKKEHVRVFKALQMLHSIGLVRPVDEEHMYWAAIKKKSCKLTPLGRHYWKLVKEQRL